MTMHVKICSICFIMYLFCCCCFFPNTYHRKTVLIYLQAMLLPTFYSIMPSHLRHLWPLWPSLCSPINPPLRSATAHAHLSGTARRAAGPGLPGLPSIQSSWKSHLPIPLLSETIKTKKIYNKSVSGSIWEKKKEGSVRGEMFEKWIKNKEFPGAVRRKKLGQMTWGCEVVVRIPEPAWRSSIRTYWNGSTNNLNPITPIVANFLS